MRLLRQFPAFVVLLMLATIPIMVYQVRNFRREESMA